MTNNLFGVKVVSNPLKLMELLVEYMSREDLLPEQIALIEEANGHMARCEFNKAALAMTVIQYSDAKENQEEFKFICDLIAKSKR